MNVLLIGSDSKIPNLALMKISAYHKQKGDNVGFNVDNPDKIYISRIFKESKHVNPRFFYPLAEIVEGGPGFDPGVMLPPEIEQMPPNFYLYPKYYDSVGRVTIGCINNCPFCVVPKMGGIRYVQPVWESYHGGTLRLLDDNIMALPEAWEETANWLIEKEIKVEFDAFDIRLINKKNAKQLSELNHTGSFHFAFDQTSYEGFVRTNVPILIEAGISKHRLMFYVYLDSEEQIPDAMHRWSVLRELGVEPFLMVNKDNLTKRLKRVRRRGCRPAIWRNLTTEEVFK